MHIICTELSSGHDMWIAIITPIFKELEPIFNFEILAKWSGIDTIPQPWSKGQIIQIFVKSL